MGKMANLFRESFRDFPSELLQQLRQNQFDRIDDAVFENEILSIGKATHALLEAGVAEDKIVYLLQKYWDLRRSEADAFIEQAKAALNAE